jgi:hypothetical protein
MIDVMCNPWKRTFILVPMALLIVSSPKSFISITISKNFFVTNKSSKKIMYLLQCKFTFHLSWKFNVQNNSKICLY